jgi:glutamine synthetase
MANANGVIQRLTDEDIEFVDLRFTDPRGKMQHITMETKEMSEHAFAEDVMFDGSSIAGWKAINESDMTLMPDPGVGTSRSVLCPVHAGDLLRHS